MWFHAQSYNIHADGDIKHYVLVTQNEIIEVITAEGPNEINSIF